MIGDRKRKRTRLLIAGGALLVSAAVITGYTLSDSIVFFMPPTELAAKAAAGAIDPERRLRLGGLVEIGSLTSGDGKVIEFRVTDNETSTPVRFDGAPPNLFREGQGVVAEGYWREDRFEAETILAKHDENYMPREVADAIKQSGQWKPDE